MSVSRTCFRHVAAVLHIAYAVESRHAYARLTVMAQGAEPQLGGDRSHRGSVFVQWFESWCRRLGLSAGVRRGKGGWSRMTMYRMQRRGSTHVETEDFPVAATVMRIPCSS